MQDRVAHNCGVDQLAKALVVSQLARERPRSTTRPTNSRPDLRRRTSSVSDQAIEKLRLSVKSNRDRRRRSTERRQAGKDDFLFVKTLGQGAYGKERKFNIKCLFLVKTNNFN